MHFHVTAIRVRYFMQTLLKDPRGALIFEEIFIRRESADSSEGKVKEKKKKLIDGGLVNRSIFASERVHLFLARTAMPLIVHRNVRSSGIFTYHDVK